VPFLNARIQGLDKMGRAASTKGERARLVSTIGAYGMAATMLYLFNKDDEEWQDQEEWIKDNYLWFRIPKEWTEYFGEEEDLFFTYPIPFEIGGIGTVMWRAMEQMVDDSKGSDLFVERFKEFFMTTLSFNPVPQAIKPVWELIANENWFTGRPIEGAGVEGRTKANRYTDNTSELAKGASNVLEMVAGDANPLSPVQIDHLIKGYLGWAGGMALKMTDQIAPYDHGERETSPWYKMPVMKRLFKEADPSNSKYMTLVYEGADAASKVTGDFRFFAKFTEIDEVDSILANKLDRIKMSAGLEGYKQILSAKRYLIGRVERNKSLSGVEKFRQKRALRLEMNAAAKEAWREFGDKKR
jgi:hypothetical protein